MNYLIKSARITVINAVILIGFISSITVSAFADNNLKIIHVNIGQGDSTLILGPEENGNRTSILIDAGDRRRPDGGLVIYTLLKELGINHLDFFIATHYDADHIGGAVTMNKEFENSNMYGTSFILGLNGVPGEDGDDGDDDGDGDADFLELYKPDPEELGLGDDIIVDKYVDRGDEDLHTSETTKKYVGIADAKANRIKIEDLNDIEDFKYDIGNGVIIECISANGYVLGRNTVVSDVDTENERSLCFLISYEGFHYLIGGDTIGKKSGKENAKVEKEIGKYLEDNNINIDVLHVNHHGADNASENTFLKAIKPEVAIISAGNANSHKHPRFNTLKRLAEAGVEQIYVTECGNTVWDDVALFKKKNQRTDEDKKKINSLKNVRKILTVAQGNIIIDTDGNTYTISIPPKTFEVDN